MLKPGGYAIMADPGAVGPPKESDTFTCIHCNKVVFVQALKDPTSMGGFCTKCMRHLCWECAGTGLCTPFEAKLEQIEREARLGIISIER